MIVFLSIFIIAILLVVSFKVASLYDSYKNRKLEEEYIMKDLCRTYAKKIIVADFEEKYANLNNYIAGPSIKILNIINLNDRKYKVEGYYYFYDYDALNVVENDLEQVKSTKNFEITFVIKEPAFEELNLSSPYDPGYDNVILEITK